MKKEYELEVAKSAGAFVAPLETRVLPAGITISISDAGIGMSRSELNDKFLFAGRRRRREEPSAKGRTPKGRLLMGRKGLGKLAGFGVAKKVEVTTRKARESHATRIRLDYDNLVQKQNVHEIVIPDEAIADGAGIEPSGTSIVLSQLLYDPLKSRPTTIEGEIAYHFSLIKSTDFSIRINGNHVAPAERTLAYAWPEPDSVPIHQLVEKELAREGGGMVKFQYRLRFTGKEEALEAAQRGVRVYAHNRLASAPSLLKADTNMHGFRMTDYLDGVVHADFIDEEDADYIATDRESLRWESPLLAGLHDFLSEEIKEACKQYQKKRDDEAPRVVENDPFTKAEIEKLDFSAKDRKMAFRFAAILERAYKRGVKDPAYKNTLPPLIQSIGHGNILTAITALANKPSPDLDQLVNELVRLAKDELEQFVGSVKGRLKGIKGLTKIVKNPGFGSSRNEKQIQKLFEECPWLVDPTYTQFLLAADVSLSTVFNLLAEELEISKYAKSTGDKKEPDLVFLIGNTALHRLVIVELKASNIYLEAEHLNQLEYYIQRAEEWLQNKGYGGFRVFGHLIGTKPPSSSRAQGAVVLRGRINKAGPETSWRVRDYLEVLTDTESAHQELLDIHGRLEKEAGAAT